MTIQELNTLIDTEPLLIVEFGSSGCVACSGLREKIERRVENDSSIEYVYVSVDSDPQVAAEYGVFSAPTVMVFAEGHMTIRESGYFSLEKIFSQVDRYLKIMGENHE